MSPLHSTKAVKLLVTVMADAIVEARGGQPVIAYTPDEEGEVTMNDALKEEEKSEKVEG